MSFALHSGYLSGVSGASLESCLLLQGRHDIGDVTFVEL